jgi:hypothetical protein
MIIVQRIFNAYFTMTSTTSNAAAAKPERTAETKQIVLKEIGSKWGKFSEQDLSALKGNDDLVTQVVAKYGLEKAQAQRGRGCYAEGPSYLTLIANGRAEAASSGGLGRIIDRRRTRPLGMPETNDTLA